MRPFKHRRLGSPWLQKPARDLVSEDGITRETHFRSGQRKAQAQCRISRDNNTQDLKGTQGSVKKTQNKSMERVGSKKNLHG